METFACSCALKNNFDPTLELQLEPFILHFAHQLHKSMAATAGVSVVGYVLIAIVQH